jgi:putative Mg2+ transporter-C (MgtC) family protein
VHSLAALSISWGELLGRLALAAALGGAIGIEREIREQEAGLRTHMLVSVGAALFTVVGAYGFDGQSVDPSRIAAQIVTGVGFLGAGAIIRRGFSVRGLTTAATLWVVAAVGLASGAGYYSAAAVTTALVLVLLGPLRIVARHYIDRPQGRRLAVELGKGAGSAPVISALERLGVALQSFELEGQVVEIELELPRGARPEDVVAAVGGLEGVQGVRWQQ